MRERSYGDRKGLLFPDTAILRNGTKKMKMSWNGSTREVTFIYSVSVITIKYGMIMYSLAVMVSDPLAIMDRCGPIPY